MKKSVIAILKSLFGLVLLAFLGWAVYTFAVRFLHWFASLRSELATAVVAAAATVLVSLVSVSVNRFLERRDAIAREARIKKVPGYEQLITFIFGILQQGKPGIQEMAADETI